MLEYLGIAHGVAGATWSKIDMSVRGANFGYELGAWLTDPANLAVAVGGLCLVVAAGLWLLNRL